MHVHLHVDVIYLELFEMTLNLTRVLFLLKKYNAEDRKPRMQEVKRWVFLPICL